ncbi:unnamed protein product [Closterium sp. NIES-54]
MASLANNCFLNYVSHSASSPATPTRGVGRFGTPRTVFSPVSYSPAKRAACNGDGETYCSSVLLKSVRPLLENLANHLADGQHKPTKSHVADEPLVKRPGIDRFEGKPAAAVLAPAPVAVTAAPVTPSAVLAPMVVTEVSLVTPVASTTPQVAEPTITTTEASARGADPNEKARWDKLRQEVRAMDFEMTKKLRARAAYLRWAKLDQATWARDIEAAIEASLPAWIAPGKTVPPVSAAAATVADSAAPAAPSAASATTVKSPVAASPVRGALPAAQESRPAVAARCKVGVETVKGKNGCTSKVVSTGVNGGKGSSRHAGAAPCAAAAAFAGSRGAASSVRAGGKASSRHASGVKRREVGGCGLGAAGRAAGGRQHKPTKSHVADEPLVKRPGIGRFEGKPAAAVLAPAPVAVTAAPVTPSAVLAPMVVTEVSLVAPVASTTPQVAEPTITTTEASARGADPNEKARWDKLRQEVRAMDFEMTKKLRARAAYLRWAKLDQATWARDIEAAIEASLPAWIAPGKTVPPVSAAAATVADSAAPAAPSAASATTVKSPVAASPVRGASPAAQESRPAVAARCKVGVETVKGKNGCTSKVVSTGVKGGKGSSRHAGAAPCAAAAAVAGSRGAASSVRAGGKAGSRHASGVKRREVGGCGLGAAGRATGGRQGGVKAAGGRAVASGMCGREGVKQQAGRREGLVHERQARPGCSSSSRAHRRSS